MNYIIYRVVNNLLVIENTKTFADEVVQGELKKLQLENPQEKYIAHAVMAAEIASKYRITDGDGVDAYYLPLP